MLIGLSGGIACGKSAAANIFKQKGFQVVDCDRIAHDLLKNDTLINEELRKRWGEEIFINGNIDRKLIAGIVFKDANELQWLESLLHPRIHEIWKKEIALNENVESNWIVEIPLLFEKKLENEFDLTICITSSTNLQISRLVRKGFSEEDAKRRIKFQMPVEEKAKCADYVIMNDGSIEFLEKQIQLLIELTR